MMRLKPHRDAAEDRTETPPRTGMRLKPHRDEQKIVIDRNGVRPKTRKRMRLKIAP
jgi:hypothetical protein